MKTVFSSRRNHYVARVGTFLIIVALIGAMGGCALILTRYSLTTAVAPGGGGTATDLTDAAPYLAGTPVVIEAVASAGYQFVNWAAPAGTFADANAARTTFIMAIQNVTVTANFALGGDSSSLVYNLAAYYVYPTGSSGSPENYPEWQDRVTTYVEYEANLITAYVQQQGISGGMPLASVEAFEIDSTYFSGNTLKKPTLVNAIKLLPSWANSDVQAVVGSWDAGTHASAMGTTAFMYLATIEADVKAMQGNPAPIYANRVYCQLAHELGHVFGCAQHCADKPCPMAQQYSTYTEWVNMGQMLWFCDAHRTLFLTKWQRGL
jgi:hypothetical protein